MTPTLTARTQQPDACYLVYIMNTNAFFAGSFNPFTIGHHDIVCRALRMFDTVTIGVGCNSSKGDADDAEERVEAISRIYEAEPRVSVISYDGLTVYAARTARATALLRGVRSALDFEYEREIAEVNLSISGYDTTILVARPIYSSVSSSMVRELQRHGYPVENYLPKPLSSPLV